MISPTEQQEEDEQLTHSLLVEEKEKQDSQNNLKKLSIYSSLSDVKECYSIQFSGVRREKRIKRTE